MPHGHEPCLESPQTRWPLPGVNSSGIRPLPLDEATLTARRPLVAVLPFAPANGAEPQRLLGAEIADLLRDNLARAPELGAILISSEFLARAPEHALELVCRQLAVGHVITGRCHPNDSLYVELVDTRDWHIHWAHYFKGNARDLLVPGAETMRALLAELRAALAHQRRD